MIIRPDRAAAAKLLAGIEPKLSKGQAARERFLLDAAVAKRKNFLLMLERLNQLPVEERGAAVRALILSNRGLYVFSMQAKLAELGFLKEKPSGQLKK